jgi:hypothetical protein
MEALDEYYEEFSKQSENPKFTINEIEQLMLFQQRTIRETLKESNIQLISQIASENKKMPKMRKRITPNQKRRKNRDKNPMRRNGNNPRLLLLP